MLLLSTNIGVACASLVCLSIAHAMNWTFAMAGSHLVNEGRKAGRRTKCSVIPAATSMVGVVQREKHRREWHHIPV